MMFVFRSTFITATLSFVVILTSLFGNALASPQFGRPFLHALDAETSAVESYSLSTDGASPTIANNPTTVVTFAPVPTIAGDASDPAGDSANGSPGAGSTTDTTDTTVAPTYTPALAAVNSAPHQLYQGRPGIAIAFAVVTMFLVF
ncbi:hypothetical protein SERLA73DRAFT_176679 [Serpula lacrymans var. lacrymans S7.3]|uniref:Uncharacterized protein n=2 Tax=Serpula lacrymans var. lacrymans TaxID=341189 RepID=F8PPJ3_SERL3|nr:uncharacterized protein SERLADRAFT_459837 [Serpula lacrymans var. lacrymans S7.9]EGO01412.1 hypothetical protein SERLA73DRAFT_176679 [Serpula lacrymans var. lacrymans S7.3]EGO27044.1 hypothetical protein SERLADRAFT_459837 [Serpula lacrymans var. lacrymans S7.9]